MPPQSNLQFTPPAFVHPQDYSGLSKSIDSLFNSYYQGQAERQQINILQQQLDTARQNAALGNANFAIQNGGLTPERFAAALPAASQPPGMGVAPIAQPAPNFAPQQQGPGPVVGQAQAPNFQPGLGQPQPVADSPDVATARAILSMHQRALQLGAAQQVAGLEKTQAEAQKAGAEASLTGAQADLLQGSNGVVDHYVNQIKSGRMTADELSNLGRGEVANAIKVAVGNRLAQEGVDINSLNNQQARNKTTADLQGNRGQVIATSAGTLEDILNKAAPLVKQLSPSQIQAVNAAWSKGQRAIKNDPTATKFLTLMGEAKGKYKQVLSLGNAPSEQDEKSANDSIAQGLSPDAYDAMHEAVSFAAHSTLNRFMQAGGGQLPGVTPAASPKGPATPDAGVQVRTLKNGQQVRVRPLGNGQWARVP